MRNSNAFRQMMRAARVLTLLSFFNFSGVRNGFAEVQVLAAPGAQNSVSAIHGVLRAASLVVHPRRILSEAKRLESSLHGFKAGLESSSRKIISMALDSVRPLRHGLRLRFRSSPDPVQGRDFLGAPVGGFEGRKINYIKKEDGAFWDHSKNIPTSIFLLSLGFLFTVRPGGHLVKKVNLRNLENKFAYFPFTRRFYDSGDDPDAVWKMHHLFEMNTFHPASLCGVICFKVQPILRSPSR